MQITRENENEDDAPEEFRDRDAEESDDRDAVIECRVVPYRGDDAEPYAADCNHHKRHRGERR